MKKISCKNHPQFYLEELIYIDYTKNKGGKELFWDQVLWPAFKLNSINRYSWKIAQNVLT